MSKLKFEDLLVTGAHFGHVTHKWHPNYKPFILMEKNGVHIINLDETLRYLNKALEFISDRRKNNGEFLRILDSSVGGFSIFPTGIIFDENNNFYISDQKNNRIIQFNEYGVTLSVFGTMGDEKGQFKVPKDVTIDTIMKTRRNESNKTQKLTETQKNKIYNIFIKDFELFNYLK